MKYKIQSKTPKSKHAYVHVFSDLKKAETTLKELVRIENVKADLFDASGRPEEAKKHRKEAKGLSIVEF